MSDLIRKLNDEGIKAFATYLQTLRSGGTDAPPFHLLTTNEFSEAEPGGVQVQVQSFANSYAMGNYLAATLAPLDRRAIAYDYQLWSWLALYFFDQICPEKNGKRDVLEDAVYIMAQAFDHRRYYRHLLRTPWLAVADNGENAKVLLITKSGGKRSDIFEQIAAQQTMFGNNTVIAAAYKLYFDEVSQSPKRGASGKGAGSPRRLVTFIKQIDLTYDLRDCTAEQFIHMLPKEFDRFKGIVPATSAKKAGGFRRVLSQILSGGATASSDSAISAAE